LRVTAEIQYAYWTTNSIRMDNQRNSPGHPANQG